MNHSTVIVIDVLISWVSKVLRVDTGPADIPDIKT